MEVSLQQVLDEILKQKALIELKFQEKDGKELAYEKAMSDLEVRIAQMERILAPHSVTVPGTEDVKFSFSKALYAITTKDWTDAGLEKEVFDAARKKALETGSGEAGGFLVPKEVATGIIELLEAKLVLAQAGCTFLRGLSGSPYELPRQSGGSTAFWVGENQDLQESALTFGTSQLTPKQVACLVKTSARLLKLATPDVESMITRDITTRLALKVDLAGLRGQGTTTQPRGVANQEGINTVPIGDNGGNINFDYLEDMEYSLEEDNALFGKLGYIWHPCTKRNLTKLKVKQYSEDTGGQYIVTPMTQLQLKDWVSYNFFQSTQVPTNLTKGEGTALTEIYFGNWEELIVADWGGFEIASSTETYDAFQKVQTWIRIIQDVDIAIRHSESFCLINDAKKVNS